MEQVLKYELGTLGQRALGDEVSQRLRSAIVSGKLAPGSRLVESAIAADLGVSRGPVRDALRKLESEGLVITNPRRGSTVAEFSYHDIQEVYSLREVLEGLAARLLAERITDDLGRQLTDAYSERKKAISDPEKLRASDAKFHRRIVELSGNSRLLELWDRLRPQIEFFMHRVPILYPDGQALIVRHEKAVQAICAGDADGAEAAMREHIQDAGARLLAFWPESRADGASNG